jgi:hypothetical protein
VLGAAPPEYHGDPDLARCTHAHLRCSSELCLLMLPAGQVQTAKGRQREIGQLEDVSR